MSKSRNNDQRDQALDDLVERVEALESGTPKLKSKVIGNNLSSSPLVHPPNTVHQ